MLWVAVVLTALGVLAFETGLALRASGRLSRPVPWAAVVAASLAGGIALLLVA